MIICADFVVFGNVNGVIRNDRFRAPYVHILHNSIGPLIHSFTEQMAAALKQVRATLGDGIPGLKDGEIEESLWYYYFDVEKTVNYILSMTISFGYSSGIG